MTDLLTAAKQFFNLTIADKAVTIRPDSAEKRDAIWEAGEQLRKAILGASSIRSDRQEAVRDEQAPVPASSPVAPQAEPVAPRMTWDQAKALASEAIYESDGRGLIGSGRFLLANRVARAIFNAAPQGDGLLRQAPTVEQAHAMGADGAPALESERLLFEAWMRGHCWALSAQWNGREYLGPDEGGGGFNPLAMQTRRLWAAWRDCAALRQSLPKDPA